MKPKRYDRPQDLFQDTWKYGTTKQKEDLLKASGLHTSWAKTKSVDEMVKRGGGMAANQLGKVFTEYVKRHKGTKNVNIWWR
jgi:hypothetical protein